MTRRAWALVAGAAFLVAAGFLLFQASGSVPGTVVEAFGHRLARYGIPRRVAGPVVQFTLNVLLFVPPVMLGAVRWPRMRWWHWALLGLAASATVELIQLLALPEREPQVADVVANTLGAVLGGLLAGRLRRIRR